MFLHLAIALLPLTESVYGAHVVRQAPSGSVSAPPSSYVAPLPSGSGSAPPEVPFTLVSTNPTAIPLTEINANPATHSTIPLAFTATPGSIPTVVDSHAPPLPTRTFKNRRHAELSSLNQNYLFLHAQQALLLSLAIQLSM